MVAGHVDGNLRGEAYYRFVTFGDHTAWSADKAIPINAISPDIETFNVHWMAKRQIGAEVEDSGA